MRIEQTTSPYQLFRFQVTFSEQAGKSKAEKPGGEICSGAFAECSGLEGTMEPKVIKEGGRNWGVVQRSGPVTFATVILRRGMTRNRELWNWFSETQRGIYAHRLVAVITMYDPHGDPVLAWRLDEALAIKFKSADLNARSTEISIEELHLVHEGMSLTTPIAIVDNPRGK